MTLLGNPTRKRGIRFIFLAYASGYQVFKQHQFVLAALGCSGLLCFVTKLVEQRGCNELIE